MSLQKVWNNKKQRIDWIDLSYILGKKDKPDPRHGKPYKKAKAQATGAGEKRCQKN